MNKQHDTKQTAFINWMRRYWALIVIFVFFTAPVIIGMAIGESFGDAVHSVSMLTWPIGGVSYLRSLKGYDSSIDITVVVIPLAILGFVVISIARYLYKSKR